jgi:hypothetical protein
MHPQLLAATFLTTAAGNGKHFHIGSWMIVPILILIVIIGTAIYLVRNLRARRSRNGVKGAPGSEPSD